MRTPQIPFCDHKKMFVLSNRLEVGFMATVVALVFKKLRRSVFSRQCGDHVSPRAFGDLENDFGEGT